jgi:hypothetical protein
VRHARVAVDRPTRNPIRNPAGNPTRNLQCQWCFGTASYRGLSGLSGLRGLRGTASYRGLSGLCGLRGTASYSGLSGLCGLSGLSGLSERRLCSWSFVGRLLHERTASYHGLHGLNGLHRSGSSRANAATGYAGADRDTRACGAQCAYRARVT